MDQIFAHLQGLELVMFRNDIRALNKRLLFKEVRANLALIKELESCKDSYHGIPKHRVEYRLTQERAIYRKELEARGLKLPVLHP